MAALKEPRAKTKSNRSICVVPDCTRQVYSRGLCVPCNRAARKLIERGEATWEELESMKPPLALPKKGDQVNPLVAAFRAAKSVVGKFAGKSKSRSK